MADLFLVTFLAALLAAIVFWQATRLWSRIVNWWYMRNAVATTGYVGVIPGHSFEQRLKEEHEVQLAQDEMLVSALALKRDGDSDPEVEKQVLAKVKAWRSSLSDDRERQLRVQAEMRAVLNRYPPRAAS